MVSPFKALTLSWKVCDKDKKQASSVSVLSVQLREQKEKERTQEEVPRHRKEASRSMQKAGHSTGQLTGPLQEVTGVEQKARRGLL